MGGTCWSEDVELGTIGTKRKVADIVAQLVKLSLTTPEVRNSNPVIGKMNNVYFQLYRKDEK